MSQEGITLLTLDDELRAQLELISRGHASTTKAFLRQYRAIGKVTEIVLCKQIPRSESPQSEAPKSIQVLLKSLIEMYAAKAERFVSLKLGRHFGQYWAARKATPEELDRLWEERRRCEGEWPGDDFVQDNFTSLATLLHSVIHPGVTPDNSKQWWDDIVGDVVKNNGVAVNDTFVIAFARGAIAYITPKTRWRRMDANEAAMCGQWPPPLVPYR